MSERGITALEIVALVVIGLIVAALLVVLMPRNGISSTKVECMNNVRQLVGLLEIATTPPTHDGTGLVLYLVQKGEYKRDEDHLSLLFCPGDPGEDLARAGGVGGYEELDLAANLAHLTSYVGGSMTKKPGIALIADDSDDHHEGEGLVVGFTGGRVRWRDKLDDWGIEYDTKVVVGPKSVVPELRCLVPD